MDEDIVSQGISLAPECVLSMNNFPGHYPYKCQYIWDKNNNKALYIFSFSYLLLIACNVQSEVHLCAFVFMYLCARTFISIYHLLIFLTFRHVVTCLYKIVLAYAIM